MKREPVESSMLRSVGYDPKESILEAEFQSGRIYQYGEVPPEEYAALLAASSKGSYFLNNIRDAYPYWPVSRPRRRR